MLQIAYMTIKFITIRKNCVVAFIKGRLYPIFCFLSLSQLCVTLPVGVCMCDPLSGEAWPMNPYTASGIRSDKYFRP